MHGFLVDNFIEVEVVLLSSQVVIANAMENSDLFWGVRGGSGNFGIVTKFTFKVHVLPPHCIAGTIVKLTPTLASAVQVCSNFDKAILVCHQLFFT
jgi:FAD/FMN-containing dehydrogenase